MSENDSEDRLKRPEACVDPQTAVKLLSIFEGRNESAEEAA